MRDYVKQRTAGPASLQIAFVPQADGDNYSDFVISSGVKLLSCAALVGGGPCTCPQQCLLHVEACCMDAAWRLGVLAHRLAPYQVSCMCPTML